MVAPENRHVQFKYRPTTKRAFDVISSEFHLAKFLCETRLFIDILINF